jgi:coenzyme F420 hydrogenase subunit beta
MEGQIDVETCPQTFAQLKSEVIDAGLCTHCGTCVGLSGSTLQMSSSVMGPIPTPDPSIQPLVDPMAREACPGRRIDYPELYYNLFGRLPRNWLIGPYQKGFVGYSAVPDVRRRGASGGVITQTLLWLMANDLIDGAVVLRQGAPKPWLAEPIIAQSFEEVQTASQSVYVPVPVNTILPDMEAFEGRLAYVGLPDQVASLRRLQALGHPGALKVTYVIGPYVGTGMYLGAIESYLRSNGVDDLSEIVELRYREGEWPGYLQIKMRSGRVLRAEKFYYNYLIPFHITQSSLLYVDFSNELTDISVGDAWRPQYEKQGGGFSVVVARSNIGLELLETMRQEQVLILNEVPLSEVLNMHAHMFDFKKRGAFIRLEWRKAWGKNVPDYGYRPKLISLSRKMVELVILSIFGLCRTKLARKFVELVPLRLIGPLFNILRKSWKRVSKPTKRKGLGELSFEILADDS